MAATKIDAHRIIRFANSMIRNLNETEDIALAVNCVLTCNENAKRNERTTKGEVDFVLHTINIACRNVFREAKGKGLKIDFYGCAFEKALNEEMGAGFFEIFCENYITFNIRMHGAEFAYKLLDVLIAFHGKDYAGRIAAMDELESAA